MNGDGTCRCRLYKREEVSKLLILFLNKNQPMGMLSTDGTVSKIKLISTCLGEFDANGRQSLGDYSKAMKK